MRRVIGALAILIGILCLPGLCFAQGAPVPLTEFDVKDGRVVDLTKAVELRVAVNHCEYGEPEQIIRDVEIVQKAADAVRAMTVDGLHDQISSTGTYYGYSFYDADGGYIFGASFQDGMLMETEGRYDVSGLDALFDIECIMLADDWNEYWRRDEEIERAYLSNLKVEYPASIFDLRGYAASRLSADDVTSVEIYVSWNDEAGRLNADAPELIARVFEALMGIRATGSAPEDGDGLTYYVTLRYIEQETGINRSVWFRFEGDRLECGEQTYSVAGLENLFDIEDVDVLEYLREHFMD